MKTALYQYCNGTFSRHSRSDEMDATQAGLVLCFGAKHLLGTGIYDDLKNRFSRAGIAICSTAGEIFHTDVCDSTISIAAIQFSDTQIVTRSVSIDHHTDSYKAGLGLVKQFPTGLSYLLVLSDGSKVNGSELVNGLNDGAGGNILVTGGLAGDGANFQSTLIGLNAAPREGLIAGIGFYGDKIKIHHGSQGGWEMFGLEKTVTRSDGNVLYEIEGRNALELYKKYLGAEAGSLPGSALLFPLSVILPGGAQVVRTILSIDESAGSMRFAGDIPEGAQVRFMKANFDKITDAASGAALQSLARSGQPPGLALLISCVGRKLILQSRTDEEVAAVNEIFGGHTLLTGFYSYGEISPIVSDGDCHLQNQTMTITTFYETE